MGCRFANCQVSIAAARVTMKIERRVSYEQPYARTVDIFMGCSSRARAA